MSDPFWPYRPDSAGGRTWGRTWFCSRCLTTPDIPAAAYVRGFLRRHNPTPPLKLQPFAASGPQAQRRGVPGLLGAQHRGVAFLLAGLRVLDIDETAHRLGRHSGRL